MKRLAGSVRVVAGPCGPCITCGRPGRPRRVAVGYPDDRPRSVRTAVQCFSCAERRLEVALDVAEYQLLDPRGRPDAPRLADELNRDDVESFAPYGGVAWRHPR
jgi:hypothetical protein